MTSAMNSLWTRFLPIAAVVGLVGVSALAFTLNIEAKETRAALTRTVSEAEAIRGQLVTSQAALEAEKSKLINCELRLTEATGSLKEALSANQKNRKNAR